MAGVKKGYLCLWLPGRKILSMTSPALSPLIAAERMRDAAAPRQERPVVSRLPGWFYAFRSARTRDTFPVASTARTRTV
jgi:hypothetical protein